MTVIIAFVIWLSVVVVALIANHAAARVNAKYDDDTERFFADRQRAVERKPWR